MTQDTSSKLLGKLVFPIGALRGSPTHTSSLLFGEISSCLPSFTILYYSLSKSLCLCFASTQEFLHLSLVFAFTRCSNDYSYGGTSVFFHCVSTMLIPKLMQYFMQNYCIRIAGPRVRASTLTLPTVQYLVAHPKTAVAFFPLTASHYLFNAGLKCVFTDCLSLPLFYGQFMLT